MIIHSKFNDYYDGVAARYYDKADRRYIRKSKHEQVEISSEIEHFMSSSISVGGWRRYNETYVTESFAKKHQLSYDKNKLKYDKSLHSYKGFPMVELDIRYTLVGFCGKLYPVVRIRQDYQFCAYDTFKTFKVDQLDELYVSSGWKNSEFEKKNLDIADNHRLERLNNSKEVRDLFIGNNTPCFKLYTENYKNHIEIDCCLKDFGFQSFFDPFATYQEIDMYIGNDLLDLSTPEMPVGGDVVVAESKGYDKHSFRQEKGTKKRKKKRKDKSNE